MSANDGHYILTTLGNDGRDEHRVALCQDIDGIYLSGHGRDSAHPELDLDVLRQMFGTTRVFNNRFSAYAYATQQESRTHTVNGIVILMHNGMSFPLEAEQVTDAPDPA